ncbi:hypothetical protein UA38_11775 [Photobacterium kishitanii]|uniref:DUF2681 domain-containing protein n=1 Tax=Photobacterium kishitanii TaxID=318456 RepID=A0AAX0YR86_9GAMM|nr:hypothetical protein [Photobacterium kishitanii]KJG57047.1 hypothetical protein UA38_11775 [Photobacterium kishitanii]KJG60572.1 hypothetical protein UA42_14565 [Photobacterium kishitanii]KJG64874.1 hypothetical protein UA40_14260 [Photobacterium kishitanii]KJG68510.1 hypothetical protein UA41_16670 [Photobacterium kishitanii]OBU31206.1 hypothetical protein AYY23_20045 [Photobacterium kishitanii]
MEFELITTIVINSVFTSLVVFGLHRLYRKIMDRYTLLIANSEATLVEQQKSTKYLRKLESKFEKMAATVQNQRARQAANESMSNNVVQMQRTGTDNSVDFTEINQQRDQHSQYDAHQNIHVDNYERD